MDHFIGHRQSPSLSQAMTNSFYPSKLSDSSIYFSQPPPKYPIQYSQQYSCTQNSSQLPHFEENFDKKSNLEDIERRLYQKIDMSLTINYKQVKSKLNKLKSRIDANDLCLDRVDKIIDSVSIYLIEKDEYSHTNFSFSQPTIQIESHQKPLPHKMRWRKSSNSQNTESTQQTRSSKYHFKSSFIMFE
jgi:hypothetical protein